jgi:hypothetical protein
MNNKRKMEKKNKSLSQTAKTKPFTCDPERG